MNEQDSMAFAEYIKAKGKYIVSVDAMHNAWQAACEYKDREIADLQNQLACRQKDYETVCKAMAERQDLYVTTKIELDEVTAENRKLREQLAECQANLVWYASEAKALGENLPAGRDMAVLASVNVLALDGGKRAQDRSALDAMLAQHAHDKLMEAAQVFDDQGEFEGHGERLRQLAEEQLKL